MADAASKPQAQDTPKAVEQKEATNKQSQPNNNNGKRIIVGNLPPDTTRLELKELAANYGRVVGEVEVIRQKRYGFISFLDSDDAGFACHRLDGKRYRDQPLWAKISEPPQKDPQRPRPVRKPREQEKKEEAKKLLVL